MSIRCTLIAALLSLAWPALQAGAAEAPPASAGVRAEMAPEPQSLSGIIVMFGRVFGS